MKVSHRLFKAALLGVDILMNPERIPPLTKDYYWDKQNCPIPYTQVVLWKVKTGRCNGTIDEIKKLAMKRLKED